MRPALVPLPGLTMPRKRRRNLTPHTEDDYRAWALCSAAYDVISKHVALPICKTDWLRRNNNAARELSRGGTSADDVRALLTFAYTDPHASRYFSRLATLSKLIEHWPTLAAMRLQADATAPEWLPSPSDDIPLLCDLVAAGLA